MVQKEAELPANPASYLSKQEHKDLAQRDVCDRDDDLMRARSHTEENKEVETSFQFEKAAHHRHLHSHQILGSSFISNL